MLGFKIFVDLSDFPILDLSTINDLENDLKYKLRGNI